MRSRHLLSSTAFIATSLILPATGQAQTGQQETEETGQAQPSTGNVQASIGTAQAAEEGAPEGLGEIIVTAQRRAESVQDVPIAITAFSAEQLESQGITEALDLIQFVPNLFGSNNTGLGSANTYFLRGLGSTETIATFDPPVGTYIDDIYLSRQNANNFSLFDVERIEVLRGPQGTLFGRNTTGGAINIIMRRPGDEFGGYVEAGYGRYDSKLLRASIDLPLMEGLSTKISGFWQDDDGYVKNVTTGDRINEQDGWGARGALRFRPSTAIDWNASYVYLVSDALNLLNFNCNPAAQTQCKGRYATTGLPEGRRVSPSPYTPLTISGRKASFGLGNHAEQHLLTSNLEFGLSENLSLNLITGYVSLRQEFAVDFFDGRGASPSIANPNPPVRGFRPGGFSILNDGKHEQFTQEVKLAGSLGNGFVDFVTGVFYINEDNRTDFADVFNLPTPAPGGLPLLLADRTLDNSTESYAAYGQADFNVTEQIKLTAGIRYTDEKKTFSIRDNRASCNDGTVEAACLDNRNLFAPTGLAIPRSQRVKLWTPRFAVNYEPNRNLLFYASATRGFKSGGWNARGAVPGQLLPFGPEKAWNYEGGMKSDWLNGRLRANLNFYHINVSDLQTSVGLVNPTTGAITFLISNFADYRNRGLEAEFSFLPVEGLNLFANIGYQDDKYIIDRNAPAANAFGLQSIAAQQAACRTALAAGRIPGGPNTAACGAGIITATGDIATPVRTPDWSLAVGGSYQMELGVSGMKLIPAANAAYRSSYEVGTASYTIYTGSVTGTNGTFPANPTSGQFITGSRANSYWLINASLALQGPNDRWQLSVDCQNCFSEVYLQSALANYSYISAPGTWMVKGRVRF